LAYEILEGPYDWNRYPLAPLEGAHRLVFKKHKNIKTYLSRPKIPEKY
jgi:hypothetical protein